MNDCRVSVSILVGMAIATIDFDRPILAVPPPAPMLVAQRACVVTKATAVFATPDTRDPTLQNPFRPLSVDAAVALLVPLPSNPPARVAIKPNGFVDFAALDCGGLPVVQPPIQSTRACRLVRDNVQKYVLREPRGDSSPIELVTASMPVWITQTATGITRINEDNQEWVQVDLQRTFRKNFGISSGLGWLSNTDPTNELSTLVNGCP